MAMFNSYVKLPEGMARLSPQLLHDQAIAPELLEPPGFTGPPLRCTSVDGESENSTSAHGTTWLENVPLIDHVPMKSGGVPWISSAGLKKNKHSVYTKHGKYVRSNTTHTHTHTHIYIYIYQQYTKSPPQSLLLGCASHFGFMVLIIYINNKHITSYNPYFIPYMSDIYIYVRNI